MSPKMLSANAGSLEWNALSEVVLSCFAIQWMSQVYEVVAPTAGASSKVMTSSNLLDATRWESKSLRRCISPPLLNAFESLAE